MTFDEYTAARRSKKWGIAVDDEAMNDKKPQANEMPAGAASALSAMFGFTVGQEVTVTRKLWEPPDDCHPGCLLAIPGDGLIVRSFGGSQQHPISVSHHDRTDGMTFFASPDELTPNAQVVRREAAGVASERTEG
jgi:hypothetical protein